ncbi:MAG: type II toxin-antitoxin system RelE/ParE family toxin [Magnetococcales bacterium]|nr:type II toxin-antitoxin system RelE/ParE family toxin [Magnetococcales bacterium]
MRVKESRNLNRLIVKVRFEGLVIVLHGFTKKERHKTPTKELDIAFKRYQKLVKKP